MRQTAERSGIQLLPGACCQCNPNTWLLVKIKGLPANGGFNFAHHAKVNVGQLTIELEEVARVGVTVIVPLL